MKDLFTVSEIEIKYKPLIKSSERKTVSTAKEVYDILLSSWNSDTIELFEEFKIVLLNTRNKIIGIYSLSKGGTRGTCVDIKLIFGVALKAMASTIILAHNHPSGGLKPSAEDINITQKIKQAGRLLDIEIVDHLIITNEGFYSFQCEGAL